MPILLLRHASAGSRRAWKRDDLSRPLDRRGRAQAEAIVATLRDYPIDRIVTSPFLRCKETVGPISRTLGIEIEESPELADGASSAALRLLAKLAGSTALACTHRAVIAAVIGEKRKAAKGSTWVLEAEGGRIVPSVYLPPPR
jgi:8-oxo-dGTP diphosphatase